MIKFDLFKKEDFALLLEGFNTIFLQAPIKRAAKSLLKFIPNGFRPEKLARFQLNKVFVEALYSCEPTSTLYISGEIQRNFDESGIESYMADKLETEYPINTYIIEISTMVFKNHLVIPAHLVLMLYGIVCTEEEKKLSECLHSAFQAELEDVKKSGYEEGYSKSEAKFASDLESERKKVAKLQKQVETESKRAKESVQVASQSKKQIVTLDASLREAKAELATLQDSDKSQKAIISYLKLELEKTQADLHEASLQVSQLSEEASNKFSVSQEELKTICIDALKLLTLQSKGKKEILDLAKKRFSDSENVAVAWKSLCNDSIELINELFEALTNKKFELDYFDKFVELESLLVLESAIKQALCTVAHKTMAHSEGDSASCGKFAIQE